MPELEIKVEIKEPYGNRLVYPVCDKAKLFASLAGIKTLGEPQSHYIKNIKALGYKVIVVQNVEDEL